MLAYTDVMMWVQRRKQFTASPVDAEDPAGPVVMNHALPESGADVERVVQIFRRDEDVRIYDVRQTTLTGDSRLAYGRTSERFLRAALSGHRLP